MLKMKKLALSFLGLLMVLPVWAAPTLSVSPQRLTFECYPGRTYYRTFTVTGTDLTQDLTLTMYGDDLTFSMDKTVITPREAVDGVQVKVYFKPASFGDFGANIWIKSDEVSQMVQLFGVGEETPGITTSTTELNLACAVDGMATASFSVTGSCLEEGIWLILEGDTNRQAFSIDKTSIPYDDANGTTTVTVSYQPQELGCDTATVFLWSHYANDVVVTLYGTATRTPADYDAILMADVYDVKQQDYQLSPASPPQCGLNVGVHDDGYAMELDAFGNALNVDFDYTNMTASLSGNSSLTATTTTDGINEVTTEVRSCVFSESDLGNTDGGFSPVQGFINADETLSFEGIAVRTDRIITIKNARTHTLVSCDSVTEVKVYRNAMLVLPNGVHAYGVPLELDPGTAQPMLNASTAVNTCNVPVYITQSGDTVTVWNLYNMGGRNCFVIDNGFFEWAWQMCGYGDDGQCWYNYTPYRSYQPEGEVMLNAMTYIHHLKGVSGKVTQGAMTWGDTTFGDGQGTWSSNTFCDNVLSFSMMGGFSCEPTVWNISHVTNLIDGLLRNEPELLCHPSSDVDENGVVDIADITCLIDKLLNQGREQR